MPGEKKVLLPKVLKSSPFPIWCSFPKFPKVSVLCVGVWRMASGRGEQLRILRLTQNYARELEGLNLFDIPSLHTVHMTHAHTDYRQTSTTPLTLAEFAATRCNCLRQAGIVRKCLSSQSQRNADARHPRVRHD